MNNENVFQGWIASLSDGTQRFEGPEEPGKKTPWQQLLDLVVGTDLKITGLQMKHFGVTINAMPHKMCDGYFQAYEARKKLIRGTGENAEREEILHGIGSVIDDIVYITWFSLTTGRIYQDVRYLSSCKIHTSLREVDHGRRSDERGSG